MGSQKLFVEGDDGVFRRLNDKYTVTIHFDTKEEQECFLRLLKNINDLKMELPGKQEEKHENR